MAAAVAARTGSLRITSGISLLSQYSRNLIHRGAPAYSWADGLRNAKVGELLRLHDDVAAAYRTVSRKVSAEMMRRAIDVDRRCGRQCMRQAFKGCECCAYLAFVRRGQARDCDVNAVPQLKSQGCVENV